MPSDKSSTVKIKQDNPMDAQSLLVKADKGINDYLDEALEKDRIDHQLLRSPDCSQLIG